MIDIIVAITPALCVIMMYIITKRELIVTKEQNKLLWEQNELLEKGRGLLFKLLLPILEEDNDE